MIEHDIINVNYYIFLNAYLTFDPDLKHDTETLLNIELLKFNLNQSLTSFGYDYEAYLTV